jgi:hypothetical protein
MRICDYKFAVYGFFAEHRFSVSHIAKAQVKAETQRLRKSLKDNPIADPNMAGLSSGISTTLEEATQPLISGKWR